MQTYRKILIGPLFLGIMMAQNAYVQLIHTVADVVGVNFPVILDSIDIYISPDSGANWTLAAPDFKFRQATPFVSLPANNNQLLAGIAPGNSSGPGDILLNYPIPTLSPNTYYVATIAGTIDFVSLSVDVDIYYFSPARNATSGSGSNDVDILLFHGSPDAGPVSYYWAFDRTQHAYVRDGHLSYRGYSTGYRTLSLDNILVLGDSVDQNVIMGTGFYYPPRSNNTFWNGQSSGVIFVSGYLNTADPNKQLGVHLALPDGTVRPLSPTPVRRIQIVHNAADPALAQVDIHPGSFPNPNRIQLDFRQATPAIFVEGMGTVPLTFTARGTTNILATVNVTLPPAGSNAAVFAQGVVNPSNFAANPNNISTAFGLKDFTGVKGVEAAGSFAAMAFHGVTDAPTVDVEIVGVGTVSGLSYGSSSPVPVTFASGTARRININAGSAPVASFELSASQAQDQVGAIIFASGFLNPANNQNGPAFGLYIVYPTGQVEPLSLLSGVVEKPLTQIQVSTMPVYNDSWTVALSAASAGKLPYRLVTSAGQILSEGIWEVPGAGSWVYTIPAQSHSSGIYLLQVGEKTYRLIK